MNEVDIKYLEKINGPEDLDDLNDSQLKELANELRYDVIEKVSKTYIKRSFLETSTKTYKNIVKRYFLVP